MTSTNLSLYAQYVKERTGRGILECEHGFATFEYVGKDTVYIVDIYIVPEKRKSHLAKELADTICQEAVKQGKKYLLGSVDTTAKGAETSIKVLLAYGMRLHSQKEPMLYFIKTLVSETPVKEEGE